MRFHFAAEKWANHRCRSCEAPPFSLCVREVKTFDVHPPPWEAPPFFCDLGHLGRTRRLPYILLSYSFSLSSHRLSTRSISIATPSGQAAHSMERLSANFDRLVEKKFGDVRWASLMLANRI